MKTYNHDFYEVRSDIDPRDIRKMAQLAFAVNHDNGKIIISRQGHGSMVRAFNLDRSDYEGGWLFPRKRKVRFSSGTLGPVTKHFDAVLNAIAGFIGVYFDGE